MALLCDIPGPLPERGRPPFKETASLISPCSDRTNPPSPFGPPQQLFVNTTHPKLAEGRAGESFINVCPLEHLKNVADTLARWGGDLKSQVKKPIASRRPLSRDAPSVTGPAPALQRMPIWPHKSRSLAQTDHKPWRARSDGVSLINPILSRPSCLPFILPMRIEAMVNTAFMLPPKNHDVVGSLSLGTHVGEMLFWNSIMFLLCLVHAYSCPFLGPVRGLFRVRASWAGMSLRLIEGAASGKGMARPKHQLPPPISSAPSRIGRGNGVKEEVVKRHSRLLLSSPSEFQSCSITL